MISVVAVPTLVLVSGVPGSGKTTLAEELGRRVPVPVLCKDAIKEGISLTEGASATFGGPIAQRSFSSLFASANVLVDAGCSLIVEAAFHRSPFATEAASLLAKAAPRVICCKVDATVAAQRYEERALAGGVRRFAHPDELMIERMRSGRFPWDDYDLAPLDLPSLVVDTTNGYAPGLDAIVEFVTS